MMNNYFFRGLHFGCAVWQLAMFFAYDPIGWKIVFGVLAYVLIGQSMFLNLPARYRKIAQYHLLLKSYSVFKAEMMIIFTWPHLLYKSSWYMKNCANLVKALEDDGY